jgi:hypothetical protein
VIQHCTKDFNQPKDNTTLIYDDCLKKRSISVKIPEEYGVLTQLLTEDKIYIYEICESCPQIYETYYKALEKVAFERDRHKEREIPEFNWIYGHLCLGKTDYEQDSLKTYDLMKKHDFLYIGFRDHKNIIYENVTNKERQEHMMKMFSGDPLIIKIPCYHYNFYQLQFMSLGNLIQKNSAQIIENMRRRMGIVIYNSKYIVFFNGNTILISVTSLLSIKNNNIIKNTKIFIISLRNFVSF